jgi:hypothetical protein
MDEFTDLKALQRAVASHNGSRKWHIRSTCDVYVDGDEKIIGEVSKALGSAGYYAIAGKKHLGEYLTEEAAKRAVERNA